MKLLMVANHRKDKRYPKDRLKTLLKAQIQNSLELGWLPSQIVIFTNFGFSHKGVDAFCESLNDFCLTGSKMFAVQLAMRWMWPDTIWAHDLDCWQNVEFEEPKFPGDVGIARYSTEKYNGGSVFWKPKSRDIVDNIVNTLKKTGEAIEEPTLNKMLRSKKFKERVSVIDNGFNVGCSGFKIRYERAEKPIRVGHFHPYNRLAWETFALNRHNLPGRIITERLEKVIRYFFPGLPETVKVKA